MQKSRFTIVTIFTILAATSLAAAQEYRYAIFHLPSLTPWYRFDGVGGIGPNGDCLGSSPVNVGHGYSFHGVLWPKEGGVIDLGTLGGDLSGASAMNALGDIVGASTLVPGNAPDHAFLLKNGVMTDLGTLGGEESIGLSVNNIDQVVGQSRYEPGSGYRAFLWQDGRMMALPGSEPETYAYSADDINNSGDIVGWERAITGNNALLWHDGQATKLGTFGGEDAYAHAINDLGQIVGESETSEGGLHAFVWQDGIMHDITSPRFTHMLSYGMDINDGGQVVGSMYVRGYHRDGFIWEQEVGMLLLNTLCPPNPRYAFHIDHANINNAGLIAASVSRNFSEYYAALLTPVHPTLDLTITQPARAGADNTLTVTGVTPGATVYFLYSRHGGGTRLPGCDLQDNALQLDHPITIGTAVADSNGAATLTRFVPLAAQGRTLLIQAAVQGQCTISQLLVQEFE